jgi:hypothetical protein
LDNLSAVFTYFLCVASSYLQSLLSVRDVFLGSVVGTLIGGGASLICNMLSMTGSGVSANLYQWHAIWLTALSSVFAFYLCNVCKWSTSAHLASSEISLLVLVLVPFPYPHLVPILPAKTFWAPVVMSLVTRCLALANGAIVAVAITFVISRWGRVNMLENQQFFTDIKILRSLKEMSDYNDVETVVPALMADFGLVSDVLRNCDTTLAEPFATQQSCSDVRRVRDRARAGMVLIVSVMQIVSMRTLLKDELSPEQLRGFDILWPIVTHPQEALLFVPDQLPSSETVRLLFLYAIHVCRLWDETALDVASVDGLFGIIRRKTEEEFCGSGFRDELNQVLNKCRKEKHDSHAGVRHSDPVAIEL